MQRSLIAIIAGTITFIEPNHRPFSLVDPDISFPYVEHQKVSTSVLFVVSLVAPAIIIALVSLVFVPNPIAREPKSQAWKRKLWEWNVGWMGLALSCAVTTLFTNALKLLIGRPRPDLLSRCDPNLSEISSHVLGGIRDQISEGTLVSWTICLQTNHGILKDAFQSFPSGHASCKWRTPDEDVSDGCTVTFAGLFYFALYLCSKFAIKLPAPFPYFSTHHNPPSSVSSMPIPRGAGEPANGEKTSRLMPSGTSIRSFRDEAAAPPIYLLILPLIPICVATYISSTRFSDFRHHGFDIIFGAIEGLIFSWGSFRIYHIPVTRGDGWAWGPRSASRAFGVSIGTSGYVEKRLPKKSDDIEAGQPNTDMETHSSKLNIEHGTAVQSGV